MKSKRGIYYNLESSEYEYKIDNFTFVFSSLFYLNLFKNNLDEELIYEQDKLTNKLKFNINLKDLILLKRYIAIEKRGFLVYYNDKRLRDYSFDLRLEMR